MERWKRDRFEAIQSDAAAWNRYDSHLVLIVSTYTNYLRFTPGFVPVDWRILKAICWVESGANNKEWYVKPMQIGAFNDPGLRQLLTTDSGKLILPPEYRGYLNFAVVVSEPICNLKAGVGFFFWNLAHFAYKRDWPRFDDEPLNPPTARSIPRAGAVWRAPEPPPVNIPKSRYAITGWRRATLQTIAQRYNGGGDGNYLGKLEYCYSLILGSIAGVPVVRGQ